MSAQVDGVTRRWFVKSAAAASAGFVGLRALAGDGSVRGGGRRLLAHPAVGPIRKDPRGVFDLPSGFSYEVIARRGEEMADGLLVPDKPDGMASLPLAGGLTALICNHENSTTPDHASAFGPRDERLDRVDRSKLFDAGYGKSPSRGGTTTIVYDTERGEKVRQFLSLGGTVRNCAGGATPWGTWLTCEETHVRRDGEHERDHGWVFEVPATAEPVLHRAEPIRAMGRFDHEAVCVDPRTGIVYQTEDIGDGLFYRYIPVEPGRLSAGGKLQALSVAGRPSLETSNRAGRSVRPGERMRAEWVDLEDVESPRNDLHERGFAAGAARFARGEGCVWADGSAYVVCTSGGAARKGQVWRHTPGETAEEGGWLELFVEPADGSVVDMPDNCCAAPWGDLVLCEDNARDETFLVGVTREGELYHLARNALSSSELAGCTFSPDGSTLFVNIQHDGLTLAVRGPWPVG